jgi:hypothetical protein
MATVDSDKVVCGGIHAKIVAVLVLLWLMLPMDHRFSIFLYKQRLVHKHVHASYLYMPALNVN